MTLYIKEVQRQFIEVYGFPENPKVPGAAMNVTDGDYPMAIVLKGEEISDNVKVIGGRTYCHNFDPFHG